MPAFGNRRPALQWRLCCHECLPRSPSTDWRAHRRYRNWRTRPSRDSSGKSLGHEVIAITNSANKVHDAKSLGAGEVLVIKDNAGQDLIDMGGADIILSFTPDMKQNSQALLGLRPDGWFVTTAPGTEPIRVDPTSTLFKQISVIGSAHNDKSDLVDVLNLAAAGKVKPTLETYPIDELNNVLARLAEGKV